MHHFPVQDNCQASVDGGPDVAPVGYFASVAAICSLVEGTGHYGIVGKGVSWSALGDDDLPLDLFGRCVNWFEYTPVATKLIQ